MKREHGDSSDDEDQETKETKNQLLVQPSRIWKVKVPKALADKWEQQRTAGQKIGSMQITEDTGEITIHVEDLNIPQNYKLKVNNDNVKNEYVFEENGDIVKAITGQVYHDAACAPIVDDSYRNYMKTRSIRQEKPVRSMKLLDDQEGKRNMFISGNRDKTKDSFSILKKRSGLLDKRERMPKGDLLNIIFAAFERKEYWQFKAMADHTNQPHAWLKEVLNGIAILNKDGPYAQNYELKSELKR